MARRLLETMPGIRYPILLGGMSGTWPEPERQDMVKIRCLGVFDVAAGFRNIGKEMKRDEQDRHALAIL